MAAASLRQPLGLSFGRLPRLVRMPEGPVPPGRLVELPGRGTTYLTDVPGPEGAPAVLLLHAVACTGMLTWYPAVGPLSRRYRVVAFDQRWHGQGIHSGRFSLRDCADDAAAVIDLLGLDPVIVAGYSMGSVVAQRVWRQHPDKVSGLVLCATTDRFRSTLSERVFHQGLETSMHGLRGLSRSRSVRAAARGTARVLDPQRADIHDWALSELRKTSPWAVGQAVAALGRHHSTPWLGSIDVPTGVVVTGRDRVIPAARQRGLAARIPAATVHEVPVGHAGCVLEADAFLPGLLEAVAATAARVRDRAA
jgi:pimeloyl-ACP methyl ester carboxylesterase